MTCEQRGLLSRCWQTLKYFYEISRNPDIETEKGRSLGILMPAPTRYASPFTCKTLT